MLAADAESGKPIIAKVAKAYAREVGMVIDIEVEGETIEATANHPFWVEGEGWVEAEGLREGSRLVTKEGKAVCVESIHKREGRFKVYNLEVSGAHNYFVGQLGLLVHNQTDCGKSFFKDTQYTDKVKAQMRKGDNHAFPETVKNYESAGTVSKIRGGDGVEREMLRIPGSYNGEDGVFEFIKEPNGDINHRLFKPNRP